MPSVEGFPAEIEEALMTGEEQLRRALASKASEMAEHDAKLRLDALSKKAAFLQRNEDEHFPGDTRDLAEEILQIHAGLDVTSQHGRETPRRFVNMLNEITACSDCNGDCMKWKVFRDPVDQMVVINRIPFASVCNHHVVPFVGHAWIGYVPDGNIAGLSKFARVVHHFARRLQVQEGLTNDIAEFLDTNLKPAGVIVVLEAEHLCMTIRGVQVPGTTTRTVEVRGVFADHSKTAKQEFLMGVK